MAAECKQAAPVASEAGLTVDIFMAGRAGSYRHFNKDITQGCTIVCPTNQGIRGKATRAASIRLADITDSVFSSELDREELLKVARAGGYWSYVAGTCYTMLTNFEVAGISIVLTEQSLPSGKGLSSSACICAFVVTAFSLVYDLKLSARGIMEFAYLGETVTPSKCGRMDQACAFGVPVIMFYDGDFLDVSPIDVKHHVYLVIVDLHGEKDTKTILDALQAAFPVAHSEVHKGVHTWLGSNNLRIATQAAEALQTGDVAQLGRLMVEAQKGMDEFGAAACPSQLKAPLLHKVMACEALREYVHAVKCVGAGGDGTAQVLCKDSDAQREVMRIIEEELGMTALPLTLSPKARLRSGSLGSVTSC